MLSAFVMIILGSFGTAFGPRLSLSISASYIIYAASRFLIACGTRGINVTGFVLGKVQFLKINSYVIIINVLCVYTGMEMMGNDRRTFAGIVFEYFFGVGQLVRNF